MLNKGLPRSSFYWWTNHQRHKKKKSKNYFKTLYLYWFEEFLVMFDTGPHMWTKQVFFRDLTDTKKSTIINLNVFVPIWNRDGAVAVFWQLLLLDPVVNVSLSTGNVPDVEQSHAELLLSIKQTKTRRSFSVKQFSNYWHNDSCVNHCVQPMCAFSPAPWTCSASSSGWWSSRLRQSDGPAASPPGCGPCDAAHTALSGPCGAPRAAQPPGPAAAPEKQCVSFSACSELKIKTSSVSSLDQRPTKVRVHQKDFKTINMT